MGVSFIIKILYNKNKKILFWIKIIICWIIVNVRWERLAIIRYIYLSLLHSHTNSRTWMDLKMADTSERRVFWVTILLKNHGINHGFYIRWFIRKPSAGFDDYCPCLTCCGCKKCSEKIIFNGISLHLRAVYSYQPSNKEDMITTLFIA